MPNRTWLVVAFAVLALAAPPISSAQSSNRVVPGQDIQLPPRGGRARQGVRCAAPQVNAGLAHAQPPARAAAPSAAGADAVREVPIAFHVMYARKRGQDVGNVDLAQIQAQVSVLNAAYAGRGFSFTLASVDRTANNKWFTGCYNLSTESEFKQALAVDPAHTLNIYSCQPTQNILGYAYYPSSYPEDSFWHGVVMHWASLPGGPLGVYSYGDTAVHEVGHWAGLYHTFENACSAPGDYVDDTPAEAAPAYDCDETLDTCPAPGFDPIHNYMDYTDDLCMTGFTDGQAVLMDDMVTAYRPSIGTPSSACGNGACESGELCACLADCSPPAAESSCTDGIDDDCDGSTDCGDSDCAASASCPSCGATGSSCSSGADCCSGRCKGRPGSRTCS